MTTVTLEPTLIKQLEQVAAEQTISTDELLETVVRTYLRQFERDRIKAEVEAYRTLHPELAKQYLGQYVAIHHGQLIDHDADFQALHTRIRQRFGRQPILVRRVESQIERELVFRSPKLEQPVL